MPTMGTSSMVAQAFHCASTLQVPARSVATEYRSGLMTPGAAGIAARTLNPARPATAGSKREWASTVDSMAARIMGSATTRESRGNSN